jgi:translation initiation factor IF-1
LASREEKIEVEGEVTEAPPSTALRVELSPDALDRGRITYCHRS